MRALLCVFMLACAAAALHPLPLRETRSIMDENHRKYNHVKDELKQLVATHEHDWAFEHQFAKLIKEKDRLKKEQFKLMRHLTGGRSHDGFL